MIKSRYYVYLLKSKVSNRTYVGYSTNVHLRLRKHNGERAGGAKKTRKGRPWEIVLFVAFPYERTALQYEFCIQHTKKYKRTSGITNKIKIMKALLRQEKICSTAPLNSELKLVIFFSNSKIMDIWNSF